MTRPITTPAEMREAAALYMEAYGAIDLIGETRPERGSERVQQVNLRASGGWFANQIRALPIAEPQTGRRVRHRKRGTFYRVVGPATMQAANLVCDDASLVVYQAEKDGALWVRPSREFEDGRFEDVPIVDSHTEADAQRESYVRGEMGMIEADRAETTRMKPKEAEEPDSKMDNSPGQSSDDRGAMISALVAQVKQQNADLQKANNTYLERARTAERKRDEARELQRALELALRSAEREGRNLQADLAADREALKIANDLLSAKWRTWQDDLTLAERDLDEARKAIEVASIILRLVAHSIAPSDLGEALHARVTKTLADLDAYKTGEPKVAPQ